MKLYFIIDEVILHTYKKDFSELTSPPSRYIRSEKYASVLGSIVSVSKKLESFVVYFDITKSSGQKITSA